MTDVTHVTDVFAREMDDAAKGFGIRVDEDMKKRFECYYRLITEWNSRMNITAITSPGDFARKHVIDSIASFDPELFCEGVSVIDVGTGGGFPGIPLKIFFPKMRLLLLDSLQKRISFLSEVVSRLGLTDTTAVHARAEEAARSARYREMFDIAVSRAVARLPTLAEYAMPFVKPGGAFLAMKGARYEEEIEDARSAIRVLGGGEPVVRHVTLPGLTDTRVIITIKKERPTPEKYPRKAGTPARSPL